MPDIRDLPLRPAFQILRVMDRSGLPSSTLEFEMLVAIKGSTEYRVMKRSKYRLSSSSIGFDRDYAG